MKPFEREMADLIVDSLALGEKLPDSFDASGDLFGELGLDSVDALEIAMAIKRRWGVDFEAQGANNQEVFASLANLAAFVDARREGSGDDPDAELFAEVQASFVEMFELSPEQVTRSAKLVDDLDLDSIDALDMMARLQELAGQRVPEERLQEIVTVGDVVDLCASLRGDGDEG